MRAPHAFGERARVRPQRWLALLSGLALPGSRVVGAIGHGRLVIVAPHPDDEVLACGGLMVRARAAGWPVVVIAVTDGERSHGPATPGRRARLSRQRAHEQRRGVEALGLDASALRRLHFPDGRVTRCELHLQRTLARMFEPGDTVVVTCCWDGHPDHEASARAARAAARDAGCTLWEAPVWLWQWAMPAAAGPAWGRLGRLALDRRMQIRKCSALRRHRSQRQPRGLAGAAVLCRDIRRRASWPVEFFFEPSHVLA